MDTAYLRPSLRVVVIIAHLAVAISYDSCVAEPPSRYSPRILMDSRELRNRLREIANIAHEFRNEIIAGEVEAARKTIAKLHEATSPFEGTGEPRSEGFLASIREFEQVVDLPADKLAQVRKALALQEITKRPTFDDRKMLFEKSLESRRLLRDALGDDSYFVGEITASMCVALGNYGHVDRMVDEAKQLPDKETKRRGREHIYSILAWQHYADALEQQNQLAAAERVYVENLAIIERRCPEQSDTIAGYAFQVIGVKIQRHDIEAAKSMLTEYTKGNGSEASISPQFMLRLAELALVDGNVDLAKRMFDKYPLSKTSATPYYPNLLSREFQVKLAKAEGDETRAADASKQVAEMLAAMKQTRIEIDDVFKEHEKANRTAMTNSPSKTMK